MRWAKELIVEVPAFQVSNGRGAIFFIHQMHAEEVRPRDLEVGIVFLLKPHFVLVARVIRRTA